MDEARPCIHTYKDNKPIESAQQLPILSAQRIPTDLFCTIFTSLFAVAMFVSAIVCLNLGQLQRMTYPTDQQARHCTLDNSNFNYLYFTSPNDPSKRLCLAQCPTGNEQKLNCWPTDNLSCAKNNNPGFQVSIYPSKPSDTSLGLFCEATDPALERRLLENANIQEMYDFVSAEKAIGVSFFCAIGFGILGVIGFSLIPGFMAYTSIILGGLGSIVAGILLIIADSAILSVYRTIVIVFCIVLCFIGILLLYASIWRQKDINISIAYLNQASKCFWQFPALALVSLVFVILLLGLTALIAFQVLAFWSKSDMQFDPRSVHIHPSGKFAIFMTVLNFIEFLWGLSFLKEAFNLIISGTTVSWYFRERHSLPFAMGNLFKFHWGSVAAGSFLLHALYPFDLVYDIIKPSRENHGWYSKLCCCCEKTLDLARSEAMILINIVGIPYCNASRWCEQIYFNSPKIQGSSSSNRYVRIGGHMFLGLLSTLMCYIYMKNNGEASVLALILSFIVNIFTLTFFICLIKDIAESIFFCTMLDDYYGDVDIKNVAKKLFPEGYEVLPTQH